LYLISHNSLGSLGEKNKKKLYFDPTWDSASQPLSCRFSTSHTEYSYRTLDKNDFALARYRYDGGPVTIAVTSGLWHALSHLRVDIDARCDRDFQHAELLLGIPDCSREHIDETNRKILRNVRNGQVDQGMRVIKVKYTHIDDGLE
jgi:hypothetical protein